MKISRDAVEIAALFVALVGIFAIAGLLWWALFIFSVGLVLLGFEVYLYTTRGETLSQQFWRLWKERPKVALSLWLALIAALAAIVIHLMAK